MAIRQHSLTIPLSATHTHTHARTWYMVNNIYMPVTECYSLCIHSSRNTRIGVCMYSMCVAHTPKTMKYTQSFVHICIYMFLHAMPTIYVCMMCVLCVYFLDCVMDSSVDNIYIYCLTAEATTESSI